MCLAPSVRSKNLALLCATIAPGARILEFGCGCDRYAAELVERGYRVTSINGEYDLLDIDLRLPVDEIDAAICLQPPQWDQDADVTRLLRAIRSKLTEHGTLIFAREEQRTVTDLEILLRTSGFDIARSPSLAWIVARSLPAAPSGLALNVHEMQSRVELNLRWSPDEVDFLAPQPEQIWASLLSIDITALARDYVLSDPWCSLRAAPVLSSFFGLPVVPGSIVFGAGATGLLRQLAPLVRAGRLLAAPLIHRDFPLWAAAEGARLSWIADDSDVDGLCTAITDIAPQVIYLDRPSAKGFVMDLESLARLCAQARRCRGLVMIDEAYFSYFAGAGSAVSLTPEVDNLIVIRSLSKAYCAGGLRVGFAVGGAIAAESFRRLVAPMQVSELAFQMGLSLLRAGDIFVHLRARITECKREIIQLLTRLDLPVVAGDARMPWVLIDDPSGDIHATLAGLGIAGKRLVPFAPTPHVGFVRLAVPLSGERVDQFRRAMGASL